MDIHNNEGVNGPFVYWFMAWRAYSPPLTVIAPGVTTIGKLELFDFMENQLKSHKDLSLDARTPEWFERGTIPGSINVPFFNLQKEESPEMKKALNLFGGKERGGRGFHHTSIRVPDGQDEHMTETWDFTEA